MFRGEPEAVCQVGMNIGSLITKSFTLQERLELAVSGYVAMDLFSLLAAEPCRKMKLPTGSTFLASQTRINIQAVSLATICVCASKSSQMNPWSAGNVRLSELAIEEFFGMIRSQSSTGQLSSRGYFQASARNSLKMLKQMEHNKHLPDGEPALTDEQQPGRAGTC